MLTYAKTVTARMKATSAKWNGGFTLAELIAALAIQGIFVAIAVPNLTAYLHRAQFQRNEAFARTIYLAAEANLTHLRLTGQWEDFKKDLLAAGTRSPETNAVYGVLLNGRGPDSEAKERIKSKLLRETAFDGESENAYICIEVDLLTMQVHAIFYSETTGNLSYNPGTDGYLGGQSYENRFERRLGRYPTED